MDINQVQFGGSYSIGNSRPETKKQEEKKTEVAQKEVPSANTEANADKIFEAMNLDGLYFKNQIQQSQTKEVNPSDYLSDDRIGDIEAAMAEFESGVNNIASVIAQEFGSSISSEYANELAAKIYAGE